MSSIVLTAEDAANFIKQHYEALKRNNENSQENNDRREKLINDYKQIKNRDNGTLI